MRKVMRVGNNEDERAEINHAFRGINVSIFSFHDDENKKCELFDPNKIKFKITNVISGLKTFDGTLMEIWAFFHSGEESTSDLITGASIPTRFNGEGAVTGLMQDFSFKFPVLHSDYEIRVITESFPTNHKTDSYVTISADYSPDAMLFEWYLTDDTVDRKNDSFKFMACMTATLLNVANAKFDAKIQKLYAEDLVQINLSSEQETWSRQTQEVCGTACSFEEEPNKQLLQNLVLHNGHILTNGEFGIDVKERDTFKFFMLNIIQKSDDVAVASEIYMAENDKVVERALSKT